MLFRYPLHLVFFLVHLKEFREKFQEEQPNPVFAVKNAVRSGGDNLEKVVRSLEHCFYVKKTSATSVVNPYK